MKQINIIEYNGTRQFIINTVYTLDPMTEPKDSAIIQRRRKRKRITSAAGIKKHRGTKFPGDTDGISQIQNGIIDPE